jgi:Tfp pilus assembly protein FimT
MNQSPARSHLIEFLLVIAIIAVLVIAAAPYITGRLL